MFYYLPLESYKERYTCLLSAENGWIEDKLHQFNIPFQRIEGKSLGVGDPTIQVGQVLDAYKRSYWSLTQNVEIVRMLQWGNIKDGDILYYDDFWTPGMEVIPYICDQLGIKVKIYAMLHAQSVDKYDFVYKMKNWLRHYEIGQSKYMAGIFVTSEYLLDLCEEAGLENVYFGGLPYNKEWIEKKFDTSKIEKTNQIIYTSRFDKEKNPHLFIELALALKDKYKFVMTTSASEIRSNSQSIIDLIKRAAAEKVITVKTNLTKHEYYQELKRSKFQINTALQDWVSWTLIESTHQGCIPVYPKYRAFPEILPSENLYKTGDIDSMVKVINSLEGQSEEVRNIPEYFNQSFSRYLKVMGLI